MSDDSYCGYTRSQLVPVANLLNIPARQFGLKGFLEDVPIQTVAANLLVPEKGMQLLQHFLMHNITIEISVIEETGNFVVSGAGTSSTHASTLTNALLDFAVRVHPAICCHGNIRKVDE